jgi:hypothetical protein
MSNGDNNRETPANVLGPADISKLLSFTYVLLCRQVSYVQHTLYLYAQRFSKYAIKMLPPYNPAVFLTTYASHICRDACRFRTSGLT